MSEPLQYASGYTLDLYCDNAGGFTHPWEHNFMATFVGETFAGCARDARRAGWKIHTAARTATCRKCLEAKNAR